VPVLAEVAVSELPVVSALVVVLVEVVLDEIVVSSVVMTVGDKVVEIVVVMSTQVALTFIEAELLQAVLCCALQAVTQFDPAHESAVALPTSCGSQFVLSQQ